MTWSVGGRRQVRWITSFAALALLTLLMFSFRDRLDKAHVALLYLLIVLGGSAVGGRVLGLTLAAAAFLSFNYFFLQPYNTLEISDPLDWLVLFTFLVTSGIAAELLDRAQKHAAQAQSRARELDQLATLGAETLNAARAEQALIAIGDVIRRTLGTERCELFIRNGEGDLHAVAGMEPGSNPRPDDAGGLLRYIVDSRTSAIEREDGTIGVLDSPLDGSAGLSIDGVKAFAVPLFVRRDTVGALRLSASGPFSLDSNQLRVFSALTYYAALGIERWRLERTEERAEGLRRADRLKDALLASVSHDLRTPLTTIKGIAHEIAHGGETDRAFIIEEEVDRLSVLVEGLLELSQLDAEALPVHPELNTVDDLFGAALQRAEAATRAHPVEVNLGDDAFLVGKFDFSHTLRIVVNLLDNAAKYSPAGTPIGLSANRTGDLIRISVSDQGPGIAVSERDRVFEPFYRVPGATPDVRGAGLGLAIAKRLAQAQGGDITVEAPPHGGATFILELTAGDLPVS